LLATLGLCLVPEHIGSKRLEARAATAIRKLGQRVRSDDALAVDAEIDLLLVSAH
jgi:hypothetical protein